MLLDAIQKDILVSLKKRDIVRLETLRFLLSAIKNTAIDIYQAAGESKMTDKDVMQVIKKQVKEHKDSIEAYSKANRNDLVEKEAAQLSILETFLPKQLSDEEILVKIEPVLRSGEPNFGILMKKALEYVGEGADGGRVAAIIRSYQTRAQSSS